MDNQRETKLDDEDRIVLDSLFRFYGSQITAHSNYLVAYAFAFAVYFYKLLDRLILPNAPRVEYDLVLGVFIPISFVSLGLFFAGRLLYYNELSQLTQNFMGFHHSSLPSYSKFIELIQNEKEREKEKEKEKAVGLAEVISNALYCRILFCLFGKAKDDYYENYRGLCRDYRISRKRSISIILSNISSDRYKELFCTLVRSVSGVMAFVGVGLIIAEMILMIITLNI